MALATEAMTDPFTDPITDLDAQALSSAIHTRALSCREVMVAYLARIQRLNPQANAIVNLAPPEALLKQADEHDALLAQGQSKGWLHGMPQAIKDVSHAAGFPTTQGNRLLANAVAASDGLLAQRMKAAGAIVIGKTNTPEFGLGSHTFNELFGVTPNAWDATRTAGGSSGGAAVALALRLLPVADGSDFMGSLRNPAGWNHVVGFRPSAGRVPRWPVPEWSVAQLGTEGPMGRTVFDVAKLLEIQAGFDPRSPLSVAQPSAQFVPPLHASAKGLRVGWLTNLNGYLAMQDGVLPVCEQALSRLASAGASVEAAALGFAPEAAWQAWLVWRKALTAGNVAAVLQMPEGRAHIKPEALWEHDGAQGLSFASFMQASQVRTQFHAAMLKLFERFDVLALPSAQVWPFPHVERWPTQIAGRTMDTYHRWMEVTIYATFAGLPAISVPAGFGGEGAWPMGLQLIGAPLADAQVLHAAQAYANASGDLLARRPPSLL
jgi:amidase